MSTLSTIIKKAKPHGGDKNPPHPGQMIGDALEGNGPLDHPAVESGNDKEEPAQVFWRARAEGARSEVESQSVSRNTGTPPTMSELHRVPG